MPREEPLTKLRAMRHWTRDSIRKFTFPQPPRAKSQVLIRPKHDRETGEHRARHVSAPGYPQRVTSPLSRSWLFLHVDFVLGEDESIHCSCIRRTDAAFSKTRPTHGVRADLLPPTRAREQERSLVRATY
jgi:hypothetical protein